MHKPHILAYIHTKVDNLNPYKMYKECNYRTFLLGFFLIHVDEQNVKENCGNVLCVRVRVRVNVYAYVYACVRVYVRRVRGQTLE